MAINVLYQPNAAMIGQAAYDVGLGDYLAREQARQFQEQQAAQAQAAQAARQQPAQRAPAQQGGRDDYLARYALAQRAWENEANRNAQLASYDLRGQYDMAQQQMVLQQEAMRQAAQSQREQMGNRTQMDLARWEMVAKAHAADEENIRKWINSHNPSQAQISEAFDKLAQRYSSHGYNFPDPFQPPPMPEWMDPAKQWERANAYVEQNPGMYVESDKDGRPKIVAPNFGVTAEGLKQKHEYKLAENASQNAFKDKEAEAKIYREAVSAELEFKTKANLDYIKQVSDYNAMKARYLKDIGDLRKQVADGKSKKDSDGNPAPADMSEVENAITEMVSAYKALQPPQPPGAMVEPGPMGSASPPQPMTPGVGGEQVPKPHIFPGTDKDHPFTAMTRDGIRIPFDDKTLRAWVRDGELEEGDWVLTPKGPKQITPEVLAKLKAK